MPSISRSRGGRLSALRRVPGRALSTEFLMDLAVMAIDRWNRLSVEEQRRFRELAGRSVRPPSAPLSTQEQKELGRLWKRLEVRRLVREGIAALTRRERKPAEPVRE